MELLLLDSVGQDLVVHILLMVHEGGGAARTDYTCTIGTITQVVQVRIISMGYDH